MPDVVALVAQAGAQSLGLVARVDERGAQAHQRGKSRKEGDVLLPLGIGRPAVAVYRNVQVPAGVPPERQVHDFTLRNADRRSAVREPDGQDGEDTGEQHRAARGQKRRQRAAQGDRPGQGAGGSQETQMKRRTRPGEVADRDRRRQQHQQPREGADRKVGDDRVDADRSEDQHAEQRDDEHAAEGIEQAGGERQLAPRVGRRHVAVMSPKSMRDRTERRQARVGADDSHPEPLAKSVFGRVFA